MPFPCRYEPYQKSREVESICFIKCAKKYNIDFPQGECNHAEQIKYLASENGRVDMLKEKEAYFQLNSNYSNDMKDNKYLNDEMMLLLTLG